MFKSEAFSRRGSLRSLRSAPLLSTVLESTLSLTRIHPITSLELPGLDYAVQSQTAISAHQRELATSLRSGIAAIAASTPAAQLQAQYQKNRLTAPGSLRHPEVKRNLPPKRALSRKLKPHLVADTVKQYISRAQRVVKGSQEQQPNMEFLRGVYAFMQVSRSSVSHVKIDSPVFRLHTNATVILLITFSIAVTTRQYVGNPIDCVHTRDIPEDVLNTYCWIHSTYTVVDAFMKKQGSEVPFPGIHNSQGRGPLTIKHTKYYQWVAFTLFFQEEEGGSTDALPFMLKLNIKRIFNVSTRLLRILNALKHCLIEEVSTFSNVSLALIAASSLFAAIEIRRAFYIHVISTIHDFILSVNIYESVAGITLEFLIGGGVAQEYQQC